MWSNDAIHNGALYWYCGLPRFKTKMILTTLTSILIYEYKSKKLKTFLHNKVHIRLYKKRIANSLTRPYKTENRTLLLKNEL
jgi:hypothetical protein